MFRMILSSLLIICIIYPPHISAVLVKLPFRLSTGLNPSNPLNPINPQPVHINPAPDPNSQSNSEAAAAASTIQPSVPSNIPSADAVSSTTNVTASSPPDITLNNTVLENPALLEEVAESTLLDEDKAVLANYTSIGAGYETYCWSARQIFGIEFPEDCSQALKLIFKEGPPLTPVTWSEARSWAVRSCAILLVPERPGAEDVFFRLDVVYAITAIQQQCVNEAHRFRGGHRGIGPLNEFHVSVEALATS